jgi:hypothetical protein
MKRAELLARIQQLKLIDLTTSREEVAPADPEPETVCFRSQTIAIVRHFFEISCQVGRLPSILGREFFHAKVSHHAIPSFEDQAVFVHDVERCLSKLSPDHAQVITMVGLYDFSKEEVAAMLRRCRGWVNERYLSALDALTQIFLEAGVLSESKPDRRQWQIEQSPSLLRSNALPPKKPCQTAHPESVPVAVEGAYRRPSLPGSVENLR